MLGLPRAASVLLVYRLHNSKAAYVPQEHMLLVKV